MNRPPKTDKYIICKPKTNVIIIFGYTILLFRENTLSICDINGKNKKLFVHHLDGNHENDNIENLSIVCSKCHNIIHKRGYNFWTSQNRKDGKISLKTINKHNGIRVESIKYINIKNNPFYGKDYGPKPLLVYNLSCSPYNTYLLDNMWVHNCDSMYANSDKNYIEVDKKELAEKHIDLDTGDKIEITAKEFSTALGDPWLDITDLKIIKKVKKTEETK